MNNKQRIVRIRQDNPFATQQMIADELGVTKGYISQVMKQNGIQPRAIRHMNVKICKVCNSPTPKRQIVCPGECKEEYYYRTELCEYDTSHPPIRKLRTRFAFFTAQGYDHVFCNSKCFHDWRRAHNPNSPEFHRTDTV